MAKIGHPVAEHHDEGNHGDDAGKQCPQPGILWVELPRRAPLVLSVLLRLVAVHGEPGGRPGDEDPAPAGGAAEGGAVPPQHLVGPAALDDGRRPPVLLGHEDADLVQVGVARAGAAVEHRRVAAAARLQHGDGGEGGAEKEPPI